MKHLSIDDIKIPKPNFNQEKTPKGQQITSWLINWVKNLLECGMADFGDFIPSKEDLAKYLGVSCATIQNSIREAKDLGYFASKQSIGTYIIDFDSKNLSQDNLNHISITQCKIKKIIIDEKIKLNEPILSISKLAQKTNISQNTIRATLTKFAQDGFLEKIKLKGNKYSWIYRKEFTLTKEEITNGIEDENCTLVHQLVSEIQKYIEKTYKTGEKILPNLAFANMFDVSIKTINDAMKILNNRKIILSRRGKHGTIYLGEDKVSKNEYITSDRKKSNFKPNYSYSWQKALTHLKKYIVENHEIGDKIAPIRELASILNVSPNTIRRALEDLLQKGFLVTKRGKLGGIFIIDMPQMQEDTYKWLALNPEAINFN